MPSPFPGMAPFLERAANFPDFHDRFVSYLSETLQAVFNRTYDAGPYSREKVAAGRLRGVDLACIAHRYCRPDRANRCCAGTSASFVTL